MSGWDSNRRLRQLGDTQRKESLAAQHQIVSVVFDTADADVTIPHKLLPPSPEDVDYQVIRASGPGLVYHDTSPTRKPWGNGYVILRSGVAGLKVDLLLTITSTRISERVRWEGGSKTLARTLLPSQIAYEDEANAFSQPQTMNGLLNVNAGIKFPAVQVASADANVLDDYEEGTFTPTVNFGTATTSGYYEKVGKIVRVWLVVAFSNLGVGGWLQFGGLPFNSVVDQYVPAIGLNMAAAYDGVAARMTTSGGVMYPYVYATSSSIVQVHSTNMTNNTQFFVQMVYREA